LKVATLRTIDANVEAAIGFNSRGTHAQRLRSLAKTLTDPPQDDPQQQ